MSNVFFIADTHFNHAKVLTFDESTRPFKTIEEHDEALIANWNNVVRPGDFVYHLGDVYLGKDPEQFKQIMKRLNGVKTLVRGNHDTFPTEVYTEVFAHVHGVHGKYGFVMSHVPLHPDSVTRWGLNVHGHLHSNRVTMTKLSENGWVNDHVDPRYYCVSVEQHNLTPVSIDTLRYNIKNQS